MITILRGALNFMLRIYRNIGSLRSIYIAAQPKDEPPAETVPLYTVQAFGRNDDGQLGVGFASSDYKNQTISSPTDAFTAITDGILDLSAGWGVGHAVDAAGNLWYVGDYPIGIDGSFDIPQMSAITNVKKIAAEHQGYGVLMIKNDGTVWYVGYEGDGYERAGVVAPSDDVETQIPDLTDIVDVKMASYGCLALKSNGELYSWASNSYGQGGNGDTTENSIPVPTLILSDVKEIVSGNDQYFAIKTNGDLYGWGHNRYGVLGLPANAADWNIYVPTLTASNVKQVSMSDTHSLYIANDGKVYGTGTVVDGELGIGITPDETYYGWVLTGFPSDLEGIAAGSNRSYGWKGNTVYACGDYGNYGTLGDGRAWVYPTESNAEPNVISYTVSKPVAFIESENANGQTFLMYKK